jgi:hypothetical protein
VALAGNATNANAVGGHGASCPGGTILVRGSCFDAALSGPEGGFAAAAGACASRGGFLPGPMELYTLRTIVFLGSGVAPDFAVADTTSAINFEMGAVAVDSSGSFHRVEEGDPVKFACAYRLVR